MNPKLVKFALELQSGEKSDNAEYKTKYISFNTKRNNIFNIYKSAFITIPVDND